MRGLFVTGTDTGAGKSVLAASLCAALAARGERVAAFKPALTGTDEPQVGWPLDHQLLAAAASAGQSAAEIAPYRFEPAVAPHHAARLAGTRIRPHALVEAARTAASRADALICEGVGGLMVPLDDTYLVRDLIAALGLPAVVAARPSLGTINHTLLTVDAARAAGIHVAGIVMTPWPAHPSAAEVSNRDTVARLTGAEVSTLAHTSPRELARAGASLPLGSWLSPPARPSDQHLPLRPDPSLPRRPDPSAAQPPSPAAYSTIERSISHSTGARSSV